MRGLIRDEVNEMNELSETRLISAAAEGKSMAELRLLVGAGADVNGTRPDGVTAIWIAAQVKYPQMILSENRKLTKQGNGSL